MAMLCIAAPVGLDRVACGRSLSTWLECLECRSNAVRNYRCTPTSIGRASGRVVMGFMTGLTVGGFNWLSRRCHRILRNAPPRCCFSRYWQLGLAERKVFSQPAS